MIWLIIKCLLIGAALVAIGYAVAARMGEAGWTSPELKRETRRTDLVGIGGIAALVLLLLSGCTQTPPPVREVTVTKEVPVPYHQPCPKAEDKPVVPKRVAEEHPVMPADEKAQIRILADKVLELFGYAATADEMMEACSKPR
jgi:hypothetical protein